MEKTASSIKRRLLINLFLLFFILSMPVLVAAQHTLNPCSGDLIDFTPPGAPSSNTYSWAAPTISPGGSVTGTSAGTNRPSINQTLINTTANDATVTYTVAASDGSNFTLTVTLKPRPVLSGSTALTSICSGDNFSLLMNSATAGTSFNWSRALVAGITPNTSTGTVNINEPLTNTTTTALIVTYVVELTANGCVNTQNVPVRVNPLPLLNSSLTPPDVCSGTNFAYTPVTNQTSTSAVWARAAYAGISNGANSGTGNPNEVLINTTLAAIPVTYVYTLTNSGTGCVNTQNVEVNINPTPTLSSGTANQLLCSGSSFNYNPTSALPGTNIAWTRAAAIGISPNSGLGNANVSEVLVNNSNVNAVTATYQFTLSNGGCINTQSFNVTVNPSPALSTTLFPTDVCSGNNFNYVPASLQSNINFAWTRVAVPGITNGTANGTGLINEALTNSTLASIDVTYTYVLTNTVTTCTNTQNLTLRVNPIPNIAGPITVNVCNEKGFAYYPTGAPIGTTYTWTTPDISPAPGAITGGSAQSVGLPYIGQVLRNTTGSPANAEYRVTPSTFGCTGTTFVINAVVSSVVTPNILLSSSLTPAAVCSGNTFNYIATSNDDPTVTYEWRRFYNPAIDNAEQTVNSNIVTENLINNTTNATTVTYAFYLTKAGCTNSQIVNVLVNPGTQLSSSLTPSAVCSNTTFNYIPTSNTPTTTFSWSRAVVAGISNIAASGVNNPTENLINTTTAPVTVTYQYVLTTANGCVRTQNVVVDVNPTPSLSTSLTPAAICSGNNFLYSPASTPVGGLFSWTRNAITGITTPASNGVGNVSEILVNSTLNPLTVSYNYTTTVNGCSASQIVAVVVKPVPVVSNQTATICSGETFTTTIGGVPAGTLYTWPLPVSVPSGIVTGGSARTLVSGISQTLLNGTTQQGILYYTITPSADGCNGLPFTTEVTVNPIPVGTTTTIAAICSGNGFSYTVPGIVAGTTYAWGNPISTPVSAINGGSAQATQNAIAQILTNLTNNTASLEYTVIPTANGCTGNSFRVTVPVSPVATIGTQTAQVCSGNSFTVTPASVPAGTTYTWAVPNIIPTGTIAGSIAQTTPVNTISQFVTNTNAALVPSQAVYTITPISGFCTGSPFALNLTVNPATELSSTLTPAAICSNTTFSYIPTSNTPSTNTFNWSRATVAGIVNTPGAGSNAINETLINNTANPLTVTYVFNLATSAGCTRTQNITLTVNPTPVLNTPLVATAICAGNTFNYFPNAAVAGTVYNWNRAAQPFISNAAATGSNNPNETLVSTSITTVSVNYVYTLTANGCSNQQTVSVPVNPTPLISNQAVNVCSNSAFNVPLTNIPATTQFTWTNPVFNPGAALTGGSAQTTPTATLSDVLSNITLNNALATYTVTPSAGACTGTPFALAVTVQPRPAVTNQNLTNVCSGSNISFAASNVPTGTTYTWTAPHIAPFGTITGATGQTTGVTQFAQTLTSNNNVVNTASYVVTPSFNGCAGNNFTITIPLNPTPVVSNINSTICSGNSFSVTPGNVPTGTTYTWTAPTATPASSIFGGGAQPSGVGIISQLLNNTTTLPARLRYNVIPTAGICSGNTFEVTVLVNPATQLSSSTTPAAVCSNTAFAYIPTSNTASTNVFNWTRAAVTGISNNAASGLNNINEVLVNTTNNPIPVTYTYNLVTTEGCSNTQTVTVTINPTPTLSSPINPPAVCSGAVFNYFPSSAVAGTSFSWTRAQQVFITNGAASGVGNPAEILINNTTTTVPVLYSYVLTANSCINQQTIAVPVSPTPTIVNQNINTCSNTTFNFQPTNVPANTVFTWTTPVNIPAGTINGFAAQATPVSAVSQTLTNQTLNLSSVLYTIVPSSGSCTGTAFTLSVAVQPIPIIGNQTLTTVCSGTPFSFAATNVPAGTQYTWLNPVMDPAGSLTGGSAQSVAQTAVSQTLSSTNNLVNRANYLVTPTANGCAGNDFTLTLLVNPTPRINNISDTICTGQTVTILPANIPANTRYTWPSPIVQPFGAIMGTTAQLVAAGNIAQTLINTTTTPARASYTITPVAGFCTGAPFQLTVHVGAELPTIPNQVTETCSGTPFNATPANMPAGTTYTWTIPTVTPAGSVTGAAAVSSRQTQISQLLNNLITNNSTVVYNVTARNTGCFSNVFTATVTVLPVPRVTVIGDAEICRYPFDTLALRFTGNAPWSFSYSVDNGPLMNMTNLTTNPYQLRMAASPNDSRLFRFTNIQHGNCLNTDDTTDFAQIIRSLPVGTMNTRRGIYICNNISDTLFITSPDSLGYNWTLQGAYINGATDDSLVTNIPGRYNALLTNRYGCQDTLAQGITLIKVNQPLLKFAYDTYCINTPMNITNLTDTNTTGPIIWRWDFGNNNIQAGYNARNIYTVGGNHSIRLTANQVYCPATPTSMDSVVDIQIPIPGIVMPSVSAYRSVPKAIDIRTIPNYRYRWTPSWGINRPTQPSVFFNYTNTQQYAVELISPAGCITRDSVLVRVFDDKLVEILIPKSFTPNGDGVNDKLYPYLTGIREFKYFKIYNRFNQLMFETKNYDEGWNGTLNGTPQPMGIYIWVAMGIAEDGSIVQRTGQTLLLR
jgi:gliding motility-associated-like protein